MVCGGGYCEGKVEDEVKVRSKRSRKHEKANLSSSHSHTLIQFVCRKMFRSRAFETLLSGESGGASVWQNSFKVMQIHVEAVMSSW